MNKSDIEKIVAGFKGIKVLIIGDVMLDTYIWGKTDRISPEAPVPVVLTDNKEYRLGGAANVALNIKSLGAVPVLCSVIGDDMEGEQFIQMLKEQHISTDGIIISSNRVTTVKTRVFSKNQQVLRFDSETSTIIDANETQQLLTRVVSLLDKTSVVIFQDYDKGVLHENIIIQLISECNKRNIPTAVDPKKLNFLLYKNATLFKPNFRELKNGLGLDFDKDDFKALEKAVDTLMNTLKNKIVFFTLASKGIYVSNGSEKKLIHAYSRNVADVSGAGDTVISMAALGLAVGMDIFLNGELANIAAGLVCQEVGVVPVNKEHLLKETLLADYD